MLPIIGAICELDLKLVSEKLDLGCCIAAFLPKLPLLIIAVSVREKSPNVI
jgi:hypothetical protein